MTSSFDFTTRAAAAMTAQRNLHAAFREVTHRNDDQHLATRRWTALLAENQRKFIDTFPGGFDHAWEKVARGDLTDLNNLVAYLEADPWHFRSGYFKELIARRLGKITLERDVADRLIVVIERRLREGPSTFEFKQYVRLGGKLARARLIGVALELWNSVDHKTAFRARDALMRLDNPQWRDLWFNMQAKRN